MKIAQLIKLTVSANKDIFMSQNLSMLVGLLDSDVLYGIF